MHFRIRDTFERVQGVQGGLGPADPQGLVASAPNQLLGLGEELDLANAAGAELDVVAVDGNLAAAFVGMDLALDGMDILDGGKVEMLAPHEGPQRTQEGSAGDAVACHRPGLDHRRPLPILAQAGVIALGRRQRDGRGRGGRVGSQPEIDAADIAVSGWRFQQPGQLAGQAHKEIG